MDRGPAIGIDLGTTFSCVGFFQRGKVDIIPNDQGNRTTPSYVAFTECERLIGETAFSQVAINPFNTLYDIKQLMGRKYEDQVVQDGMKHWPFTVINVDGKPKIQVEFKGEKKELYPEEATSMVLAQMKEATESFLGREMTNAVITVPAHFNESHRRATMDAAAISGLKVLKIINEPTAAAIAYRMVNPQGERNVMIFNFGGGYFDVSIVHMKNKQIVVQSTSGDTGLGGHDIDNLLVDYFASEFKEKHDLDISNNKKSLRRLLRGIERVKRTLSSSARASIEVESLVDGIDFNSIITRDQFNELFEDIFQSTINHVKRALEAAKMIRAEIDDVLLVGGSSRIPRVQNLLQDFFKGKELNKSINMEEAAAFGAAILAAVLSGDKADILKGLTVQDVTPSSLGVVLHTGLTHVIIPRNCVVPVSRLVDAETGMDHETYAVFKVFEGEEPIGEDNHILGRFTLSGISSAPKGEGKFGVTFSIDDNGMFSLSVEDKSISMLNDIRITDERVRLTQDQLNQLILEAKILKAEDDKLKEKLETLMRLEDYCFITKKVMKDPRNNEQIPEIDRQIVINFCQEMIEWIEENKVAEMDVIEKKEKELKIICNPILRLIS